MDDDEKEMIAETRVRLANIKGKKAKRRSREKFIEKTRQLAQLQKQRELRAAGIEYVIEKKKKKKKVEIDYNAEIPFEHRPVDTVYQTDAVEEPAPNPNIGNISLNTIEGVRRDEEERRLRKLDQKKLKKLRQMNLPEHIEKLNKVNPLMYQKKTRLVLSEPQLTDKDLELLGKMTKNVASIMNSSTSDTTRELVGNYSVREPTPVKTPKYSSQLMKEARYAYNLINAPSPMLGGEHLVAPPENTGSSKVGATPNPYKRMISESIGVSRGETPLSTSTKSRINARSTTTQVYNDELRINNDDWADNAWEEGSQYGDQATSDVNKFDRIRDIIKRSLESLPAPRNDYEIDLPELEEFILREKQMISSKNRKMDFEDMEAIRSEAINQQKLRDFYRQSQARQRNLPLPVQLSDSLMSDVERKGSTSANDAWSLIRKELAQMVVNDIVENPATKGTSAADILTYYNRNAYEEYEVEDLEKAEYLIQEERRLILEEKQITEQEVEDQVCEYLGKRGYYPTVKEQATELPELKKLKTLLTIHIEKMENELNEQLDDKESQVLNAQIKLLQEQVENKQIEVEVFEKLKEQESNSMIHRLHEADIYIQRLKAKEAALQRLYREYTTELNTTND